MQKTRAEVRHHNERVSKNRWKFYRSYTPAGTKTPGKFKKQHPLDCGNPRCNMCHAERKGKPIFNPTEDEIWWDWWDYLYSLEFEDVWDFWYEDYIDSWDFYHYDYLAGSIEELSFAEQVDFYRAGSGVATLLERGIDVVKILHS